MVTHLVEVVQEAALQDRVKNIRFGAVELAPNLVIELHVRSDYLALGQRREAWIRRFFWILRRLGDRVHAALRFVTLQAAAAVLGTET